MKIALLLACLVVAAGQSFAQDEEYFTKETCYCAYKMATETNTERYMKEKPEVIVIYTPVLEVPCPNSKYSESAKQDFKAQFFEYLYTSEKYKSDLDLLKGVNYYSRGSILEKTKASVTNIMNVEGYKEHRHVKLSDFKYQPGKYMKGYLGMPDFLKNMSTYMKDKKE
jgi:hypothetical protein